MSVRCHTPGEYIRRRPAGPPSRPLRPARGGPVHSARARLHGRCRQPWGTDPRRRAAGPASWPSRCSRPTDAFLDLARATLRHDPGARSGRRPRREIRDRAGAGRRGDRGLPRAAGRRGSRSCPSTCASGPPGTAGSSRAYAPCRAAASRATAASPGSSARRVPPGRRAVPSGRNPIGLVIPCHRVIAGDGSIGGYGGDWWGGREQLLAHQARAARARGRPPPGRPRSSAERMGVLRAYRGPARRPGARPPARRRVRQLDRRLAVPRRAARHRLRAEQRRDPARHRRRGPGAAVRRPVRAGRHHRRPLRPAARPPVDRPRPGRDHGRDGGHRRPRRSDGPLWPIVALAILATCFSSFFGPTIGAFLPTLVGDESRLGPANSAWASLDNLAFIIGPAIGGVLIAALRADRGLPPQRRLVRRRRPRSCGACRAREGEPSRPPSRPIRAATPTTGRRRRTDGRRPAPPARYLASRWPAWPSSTSSAGFVFGGLSVLTVVLATRRSTPARRRPATSTRRSASAALVGALVSGGARAPTEPGAAAHRRGGRCSRSGLAGLGCGRLDRAGPRRR